MRERPTPLEGVRVDCKCKTASQRFWSHSDDLTPSEGVGEMRESLTPSEGVRGIRRSAGQNGTAGFVLPDGLWAVWSPW